MSTWRFGGPWRGSAERLIGQFGDLPETNVLIFGFLLHLPWELWLSGAGRGIDPHLLSSGELPLALSLAAVAHAGLDLLAFWFVAVGTRGRDWIRAPGIDTLGSFVLVSLLFTLIAESLLTGVFTGWEHLASLPTFVAPGLGYASLLQGLAVPLLIVAMVRRQRGVQREEA